MKGHEKWIWFAAIGFAIYTALLVAGTVFGRIERVSYRCQIEGDENGPTDHRMQRIAYFYRSTDRPIIPDKSTAVQAATILFHGLQDTEYPDLWDYKAHAAFYDEEDRLWIVKFWSWWKPFDPVHGDWCIAMDEYTGEVLCIWVEE